MFFRNPNEPVSLKQMEHITWPKYDARSGRYLTIERNMSQKSVRKHFVSESYDFWYKLIPKVIKASRLGHKGTSYFKRDQKEHCDSEDNCP